MKYILPLTLASAMVALSACSSDDDSDSSDGGGDAPEETVAESTPGSFQVSFTNMTASQLMTPPVVAIHDPSVHLFQIGQQSSDAVRNIAETGDNAELVAFAGANPDVVSAAGVAGDGPFGAGESVTTNLSTEASGQVFSAVNMVICTNDGISGVDSIALPEGTEPVTIMAIAYDAGTRENQADAQTFFPPPCKVGDVVEAPVLDPRAPIAAHEGQSGLINVPEGANWDFAAGEVVLMIEVTRL